MAAEIPNNPNDLTGVSEDKLLAALSYLGILVLIPLLLRRNDPYVRFHAKQGLVILIGEIVAVVAGIWLTVIGNLLFVLMLIASVLGFINALQGKQWKIPGVGQLAEKFKI
jgi:fumarate reductase subunit D